MGRSAVQGGFPSACTCLFERTHEPCVPTCLATINLFSRLLANCQLKEERTHEPCVPTSSQTVARIRRPVIVNRKFLYGKKFIFSRMPVNFLPQRNLFSPVYKFISSRMPVNFLPQGNLFSTAWNLSFNRMKLEFHPYETRVSTVWNFISMRFQQYCNTISAVLARNISHFAR